jgi:tetratricopeptide (TPR) repeat protein
MLSQGAGRGDIQEKIGKRKSKARQFTQLGIPIVTVILAGSFGCKKSADPPPTGPISQQTLSLSEPQKQALAYGAQGSSYLSRHEYDRAIAKYRQALAVDPESRGSQEGLAFALWKTNRLAEAAPIWKKLANGTDAYASNAANWLRKYPGATEGK